MLKYPRPAGELSRSRYPIDVYRMAGRCDRSLFGPEDPDVILPLPAGMGQRLAREPVAWPWSVYLRVLPPVGGWMSADLLEALADLVERRGMGLMHLACGGTLEIYTTPEEALSLVQDLNGLGLDVGSTGDDLRCLVACAGPARCDEALVDAPAIATYLGRRFLDEQQYPALPRKCKPAVAGCPRDCVRAGHHDLAFMGVERPGWGRGLVMMVGGKYGRRSGRGPRPAEVLVPFVPLSGDDYTAVGDLCQRFLDVWSRLAGNRERAGDFVARMGQERIRREMGLDPAMPLSDAGAAQPRRVAVDAATGVSWQAGLAAGAGVGREVAEAWKDGGPAEAAGAWEGGGPAEVVLPAGIMPDFRGQLPPFLRERYGRWVMHDYPLPGVLRHGAADGSQCWTVRFHLPPGGMLSAESLRLLARWIREYALVGRRTSREGFELVGVDPARVADLTARVRGAGFLPGGTGRGLRQVKACVGYLHCQNALVDSPALAGVLGDALLEVAAGGIPAGLRVSVAGCPNDCGGARGADLGLVGCSRGGVRVLAGARAGLRPRLAGSCGALRARPPEYAEVVAHVLDLVGRWREGAQPGDRLGDWLARGDACLDGRWRPPAGERADQGWLARGEAAPGGGRGRGGGEA
ncbi:MAG: hypothetical protein AB1503_02000 [Bacillota bacterium]